MLSAEQVKHYRDHGYVVARGLVDPAEVVELRAEVDRLIAAAPRERGAVETATGAAVEHPRDFAFTDLEADGSRQVLNRISSPLAHSPVMLRAYGNPRLLAAVEAIYGPDWVPFSESIVVKPPAIGAPFAWHQDGNFASGDQAPERGVNFGIYLYAADEHNGCLYVVPDSHRGGRVDLQALVAEHGERLPGSIPVPVDAGDVIIHSRNLVHGSFANTSRHIRVTVYFGFHARPTVDGRFAAEHIRQRARVAELAVAARTAAAGAAARPDGEQEQPYRYRPWILQPSPAAGGQPAPGGDTDAKPAPHAEGAREILRAASLQL